MKTENLIITVFAQDQPGILKILSDVINENDGNWLESSLTCMSGLFAGILNIEIAQDKKAKLFKALDSLTEQGLDVTVRPDVSLVNDPDFGEVVKLLVEANDRPGIVEEIANALVTVDANIEQMETSCESASMAGYQLFQAHLVVALPNSFSVDQLEDALQNVSDDLIVSIIESE